MKYTLNDRWLNIDIDSLFVKTIQEFFDGLDITADSPLLENLIKLNNEIKWDTNPKSRIEAWFITGA